MQDLTTTQDTVDFSQFDDDTLVQYTIEVAHEHLRSTRHTIHTGFQLGRACIEVKKRSVHGEFMEKVRAMDVPYKLANYWMHKVEEYDYKQISDIGTLTLQIEEPSEYPEHQDGSAKIVESDADLSGILTDKGKAIAATTRTDIIDPAYVKQIEDENERLINRNDQLQQAIAHTNERKGHHVGHQTTDDTGLTKTLGYTPQGPRYENTGVVIKSGFRVTELHVTIRNAGGPHTYALEIRGLEKHTVTIPFDSSDVEYLEKKFTTEFQRFRERGTG